MINQKPKKPQPGEVKGLSDKAKIQNIIVPVKSMSYDINDNDIPMIDLSTTSNNTIGISIHTKKGIVHLPMVWFENMAKIHIRYPNKDILVAPYRKELPVQLKDIIRVGTNFFALDKDNNYVRTIKQNIEDDFGRESSKEINSYLGFKNMPSHTNYKENLKGYRNLYKKLTHQPKKGNWETIDKMLKHIFKGRNYELILTYLWVLYNQPTHPLPLLGLAGKHKNTGKTTFLEFLKLLFKYNAKFIDPEDISANFNSSYIDKIIILIDETIQGKDRRKDLQKLKKLITGGTQTRKAKFQDDVDINFYGKFIMASNDVDTFISIEDENTRFWIIEVGILEEDILDFKENLEKEIPAFIYYLKNDSKPLEKKSRLWLDPKEFETERAKILQRNSRSIIIKELIESVTDYFVENEKENEIKFSSNHFLIMCDRKEWNSSYLSNEIKKYFNKKSLKKYITNPFYPQTKYITVAEIDNNPKQCRCFTFTRDEISKLNPDAEL